MVIIVGGVPGPTSCGPWSFGMVWGFAPPCGALRFRAVVRCRMCRCVGVVGTGVGFAVLFVFLLLLSLSLCVGRACRPPSM